MLSRVFIENFRCLKNVDVPLRPLTVVVGPNDSGKTTFLHAIQTLLRRSGVPQSDFWRKELTAAPVFRAYTDSSNFFSWDIKSQIFRETVRGLADQNLPVEYYRLPSTGPSLVGPGYSDTGNPPALDEDGKQVAALLDHILRRDRNRFDRFASALRDQVPGLEDVNVGSPSASDRRVELRMDSGLLIDPSNLSTGVRLAVFFLALAFHPNPPKIMLVEEPENCLHPKRLEEVMRLLRSLTLGEHCGHKTQVILTTHSPLLLNHVELSTDQVLVFRREADGSRTAEPVDAERLSVFLDRFMLGEVWISQDEAGLVAKKT